MAEHGGYRRPRKPAPVSGPGRLSRRTDGGPAQNVVPLPNAGYGEGQEFEQIQSGANMAAAQPVQTAAPVAPDLGALFGIGGDPGEAPTPLGAPTQRPDEPVTAGVPVGPGPGPAPEVAGPSRKLSELLGRLLENDMSGDLADLYVNAQNRGL